MAYRLGIDIGGTFTDATLIDETTGAIHIGKVSSTPHDPSVGFTRAVERILQQTGVSPAEVRYLVHGTTVATNAIIEGKVARTALLTTEGFRDILEIGRQIRPSLYDLHFHKPRPLAPRQWCFGIPERLDARGQTLTPLEAGAVLDVATTLRGAGVEAVAVCFLHAYRNPAHEQAALQILAEALPGVPVSLSSDVAPEIREYYRASTTVVNASLRPVITQYLQRIEARLREAGLTAQLLVMQSSGGVYPFGAAGEKPVFMVESGPAAGVIGAAYLGQVLGYGDLLSFDMGGTTAKAGLIRGGQPHITKEYEVGVQAGSGTGSGRGSGYPIRTPVIDLVEIGAGGGSIAWVDAGGALRVGPQSAGADPGPVCYGLGGAAPTVTDANLVLGRLNPAFFLGGEITLDVERSRHAILAQCARPLGLDVVQAAHSIVEIANAAMVNALRLVSVQRGYDPRDFVLVAFGGAGPVHANRLQAEMEIPCLVVPLSPGIASALGLLVTDLTHDYAVTMIQRSDQLDLTAVEAAFDRMAAVGRGQLRQEGVPETAMAFVRHAELRYVGQSFELPVPLPAGQLDSDAVQAAVDAFHAAHEQAYGHSKLTAPVELVTLRLTAVGGIERPRLRRAPGAASAETARKTSRPVYFAESGGYVDCPTYDRYGLGAGACVTGPAIIEEFDSTFTLHPGYQAQADEWGNLLVTRTATA